MEATLNNPCDSAVVIATQSKVPVKFVQQYIRHPMVSLGRKSIFKCLCLYACLCVAVCSGSTKSRLTFNRKKVVFMHADLPVLLAPPHSIVTGCLALTGNNAFFSCLN